MADQTPPVPNATQPTTTEHDRLNEEGRPWDRWGPYVSDRQWGTVREDYSPDGTAWDYFTHDAARSRAYRWGEDGLGGWCDEQGLLVLTLALWNHKDPILKERLFGLTNSQGNHGEDVKELYYYEDAVPSHAYARMRYKYPQGEYPYQELIERNQTGTDQREFELLDTGLFDQNQYFDVVIEFVKDDPDRTVWQISVTNKSDEPAQITVLPQVTARNRWAWSSLTQKARFNLSKEGNLHAPVPDLGSYDVVPLTQEGRWIFTENETNSEKLFNTPNTYPYVKDAFHRHVVNGEKGAVSPDKNGSKAGYVVEWTIGPGDTKVLRMLLEPTNLDTSAIDVDALLAKRKQEADDFYKAVSRTDDGEAMMIERGAFAGLIWTKAYYRFDVRTWLRGDPEQPAPPTSRTRNWNWQHLVTHDILLMPDGWEYPWFAAWDLAFHTVAYSLIDSSFAKDQLELLLLERTMHPNGQIPAYEWAFSDVNPPVHVWAVHRVFAIERRLRGTGDYAFLERCFHKLLMNFTWWVNRKDSQGNNLFQGGFLGLDNIGVFDRNQPLPDGMILEQADGTSWMASYCLGMLGIALELARQDKTYEDTAVKFLDHFFMISYAVNQDGLWDEEDGFYYDWIQQANGNRFPVRARTLTGLMPLLAIAILEPGDFDLMPKLLQRYKWYRKHRPEMVAGTTSFDESPPTGRHSIRLVPPERVKRIVTHLLDQDEFLSTYGVRAVSRCLKSHPFTLDLDGISHTIDYEPGESTSKVFGGNSNWRGPVWFPINFLLVEALQKHHRVLGDQFIVDDPTGSEHHMNLWDVSKELSARLISLFRMNDGMRPIHRHSKYRETDWKDLMLYHEYFHAETGEGLGASHQTGWTAIVAKLIDQMSVEAETLT